MTAKGEDGSIRIPFALIAPIWSILAAIAGFWYTNEKSNSARDTQLLVMNRDFKSLTRTVTKLEKQVDISSRVTYTRTEAERDLQATANQLDELRSRMVYLERKHK